MSTMQPCQCDMLAQPSKRSQTQLLPMTLMVVMLLGLTSSTAAVTALDKKIVVELTDETFDEQTEEGTWMVDIYAPWCGHCRQLEPVWNQLATDLKEKGIRVAKIDGSKEKILMRRFGTAAFPSIYLLKDGNTWAYEGTRSLNALRDFAEGGYEKEEPLPFLSAPNSRLGRLLGQVYKVPGMLQKVYTILKEDHGMSDVTIMLTGLAVPVIIGALAICLLDGLYLRRASFGEEDAHYFQHQHQE